MSKLRSSITGLEVELQRKTVDLGAVQRQVRRHKSHEMQLVLSHAYRFKFLTLRRQGTNIVIQAEGTERGKLQRKSCNEKREIKIKLDTNFTMLEACSLLRIQPPAAEASNMPCNSAPTAHDIENPRRKKKKKKVVLFVYARTPYPRRARLVPPLHRGLNLGHLKTFCWLQ